MSIFSHRFRLVSKGFTLIELLLVVTIMLILTSVFLIRQRGFDSATVLSSLAYSIALSFRQAQLFGTANRETSINAFQSANPAKAYGLYFDKNNLTSYRLFADLDNDGQFDTTTELVQIFKLPNGYSITKFCSNIAAATCWTPSSPNISYLLVLFRRPNPDACFATNILPSACAIGGNQVYSGAYVQITGGENDTRSVKVNLAGQILVGAQGS